MSFKIQFLTTAGEQYFKQQARDKKVGRLSDEEMENLYNEIRHTELIVRDYKTVNYENHPTGYKVLKHPLDNHVAQMVLELHGKQDLIALESSRNTKHNQKNNTKTQEIQSKQNTKNTKIQTLRNFANS